MKQADNIKLQIESQKNQAAEIALELYNIEQRTKMLNDKMREVKGAIDVLNAMGKNNENNNDSKE